MAGGVLAYLAVAGVLLAWSGIQARSALAQLENLVETADPAALLDGRAAETVSGAEADFDAAAGRVDGLVLAPLRAVPVVGRQVEGFATLSSAAAEVSGAAAAGLAEAEGLVGDGVPREEGRVELVRSLSGLADRTAARLAAVDPGSGGALLGPLRGTHDEFSDRLVEIEEAVIDTRDAAAGMVDIFRGPSRYLLLAANNAEMRAGSGMALSVGMVTFEDGSLSLGSMTPSSSLQLPDNRPIGDRDMARMWGFAEPDREWRNLLLSPRYEASTQLATRMWADLGAPEVDGVLTVDLVALESLLSVVGPVRVDGRRISAGNVVRLMQHDQYIGISDLEQGDRRDQLGNVAQAVLDRFDATSPPLPDLAKALSDAAQGRHLLLWSDDAPLQRAWAASGVGGALPPDALMVSLLNDGNNKLDQYQKVTSELLPEGDGTGEVVVEVTNEVPAGEPRYIAGADPDAVGGYGVYPGYVAVNMPGGTELEVVEGPPAAIGGPDGKTQFLASVVRIEPGETLRWRVAYQLPEGLDEVEIQPSARAPSMRWRADGRRWRDSWRPSSRVPA